MQRAGHVLRLERQGMYVEFLEGMHSLRIPRSWEINVEMNLTKIYCADGEWM
jgi:hypothetical protein